MLASVLSIIVVGAIALDLLLDQDIRRHATTGPMVWRVATVGTWLFILWIIWLFVYWLVGLVL